MKIAKDMYDYDADDRITVITYSSPNGGQIVRCAACEERERDSWPRDYAGSEYCSVSYVVHRGYCGSTEHLGPGGLLTDPPH